MIKKILFLPEFSAFGGTRSYFKLLLKFYNDNGIQVVLGIKKEQYDEEIQALIQNYSIECVFLPSRINGYKNIFKRMPVHFFWDFFLVTYIWLKHDFDMMVCSIGTPEDMLATYIFPKKILYILHTYPMRNLPWLYKILLKRSLCTDKKIVTVSAFAQRKICELWLECVEHKDVEKVYTFSDKKVLQAKRDGEIRVLTLGHVTSYKEPFIWIQVAKKVIERYATSDKAGMIKFIWAGDGDLLEKCKYLAEKISFDIEFYGFYENVTDLYEQADIYFQPSSIESFGLCVLDAVKFGIPCVASDIGGLPEIIEDKRNGYIVQGTDIIGFSEKISQLIDSQSLRLEMGTQAKAIYEKKFSKKQWYEKMRALHID